MELQNPDEERDEEKEVEEAVSSRLADDDADDADDDLSRCDDWQSRGGARYSTRGSSADSRSSPAEVFHCPKCRKTFASRTWCRAHRRKETCRPPQESTSCKVPHEHQLIREQFDSMAEALEWWAANQMDRYFSFKGRKRASRIANCSQNVQDKRASTKKTKKLFQCGAKIIFNQVEVCLCEADNDSDWCHTAQFKILAYGCVAHSHPIEPKNLRLSEVEKTRVAQMLQSGLRSDVILDKYVPMSANSKPLTYDDIYRIRKACNLIRSPEGQVSEVDNVTALLAEEAFRGFNFGSKFELAEFPAEVKNKVAETSGQFLLSYASPKMIDMFRANPTIISIHGSSGTNSSKFVLISILIFDSNGEGCPVWQGLAENESHSLVSTALKWLKSLNPEACLKVTTILTDTNPVYIDCWRELIHPDVAWSVVHWDGTTKHSGSKRKRKAVEVPEIEYSAHFREEGDEAVVIVNTDIVNDEPASPVNNVETAAEASQVLSVERFRRTVKQVFRAKLDVAGACLGMKQVNKMFYGIEPVTKSEGHVAHNLILSPGTWSQSSRKRKRLQSTQESQEPLQLETEEEEEDQEALEISRFLDELVQIKEKVHQAETMLISKHVDLETKRAFMNALDALPMKMVQIPNQPHHPS